MGVINNYGYEKLRGFVLANWKYLEVQSDTGAVLKRFTVADGLVITGSESSTEIEYKLVLSGADPIFTGQTVERSVLFDVATGGSSITTESFAKFTFESLDDELTLLHKLQVPQVV